MTNEQVKKRGNPNFGKRDENGELLVKGGSKPNTASQGEIWATLYAAILSTYVSKPPSPSVIAFAANTTDAAFLEFKKRFPK